MSRIICACSLRFSIRMCNGRIFMAFFNTVSGVDREFLIKIRLKVVILQSKRVLR